jgi:hypothetical protein
MNLRSALLSVLLAVGCAPYSPPPSSASLEQTYELAIREAAVRSPGFSVPLRVIDTRQPTVRVATFTEWGRPQNPLQKDTWVSLPAELSRLCRGKPDTVLAIQQILGLPPTEVSQPDHKWQVISFAAPTARMIRPCPGGTDISLPQCSAGDVLKSAGDVPEFDKTIALFFLKQLWSSYRIGFVQTDTSGVRRNFGYPFTGMGWTYNWDPTSASHVGVSEYVVRKGAAVSDVTTASPETFCNGQTVPSS